MADNLGASTRRLAAGRPAVFTWRAGAIGDLRVGVGFGILNVILYAEERAKEDSVVRGGHRSFLTGAHLGGPLGMTEHARTRRGKATVGGNLRRSWYATVSVAGVTLPGSRTVTESGDPVAHPSGPGIVGYLGNSATYSYWVDQGTSKMPARPMARPAISLATAALAGLFRAGAYRYWGARP